MTCILTFLIFILFCFAAFHLEEFRLFVDDLASAIEAFVVRVVKSYRE